MSKDIDNKIEIFTCGLALIGVILFPILYIYIILRDSNYWIIYYLIENPIVIYFIVITISIVFMIYIGYQVYKINTELIRSEKLEKLKQFNKQFDEENE